MAGTGPTQDQSRWFHAAFGVNPEDYAGPATPPATAPGPVAPPPGRSPSGKPVAALPPDPGSPLSLAAQDAQAVARTVGPALLRQGAERPGARIHPAAPPGPATECTGPDGRTVSIATAPDGKVALTRDPPPIREITFSGGGGKGAALPGAVKALAASGVMQGVKEIHGASVGSMTAAMLASGMTPEMFQKITDDTKFEPLVKGGDRLMLNLEGKGLEDLVRSGMTSSLNGQIAKFTSDALAKGTPVDPKAAETLKAMSEKFAKGGGPTFADLRTLSKIIPDVKEVVISGTLIGRGDGVAKPDPLLGPGIRVPGTPGVEKVKPELMAFSADTQPDMDVARAVHASAALPPVFKPVDIPLADGTVGRFEDGGVLNNAPSSDTLGTDRAVDPVPEAGKMTFVFESEEAHGILKGTATPNRSRIKDAFAGAENSAADYGLNRALADRPEDVVMVPLTFNRADGKKADYSGMLGGTLNFDIAKDDRLTMQGLTEAATTAHLQKRREKETRAFDSAGQMMMCTTREDLQAMAASRYPGAEDAVRFRDGVSTQVRALEALADGGGDLHGEQAKALLAGIDTLAGGDQDRIAFIGRELNRTAKLGPLLKGGAGGAPSLAAGAVVQDVLAAKAASRAILRDDVYPKMVREDPKGMGGNLLGQMDLQLRDARSAADINRALRPVIEYYGKPRLMGGFPRDKDFAAVLAQRLQPEPK